MEVKVNLVTMTDVQDFVNAVSNIEEQVTLKDNAGHCVSALSLLGCLYSMEWKEVWCHCDRDILANIIQWVV